MLKAVCIDCADPDALAPFWEFALGYRRRPYDEEELARLAERGLTPRTDPEVALDPAARGTGPTLWLNRVPEPRTVKNRVHVDVYLGDGGVPALVERGARLLREPDDEIGWWVLADPEGNEFCAFERA